MDEDALAYAQRRIEEFTLVQRHSENKLDAIKVLFDSLGFDKERREDFIDWFEETFPHLNEQGGATLGLLVGLFIDQYNRDKADYNI